MAKTLLAVSAVLILMAATTFTDISRQLALMGMPKIICLQLILTYRYLAVLIREAASMFTAYILRAPGRKGIRIQNMGSFLGTLLLRSFDRAERVYQAMKCRGFDGIYRSGGKRRLRPADWGYAAVLTLGIVGLRFFNLSLFLGHLARMFL
jgi:cobalt/nickel transport system permease protein